MKGAPHPTSDMIAEFELLEQFDRDQRYIDEHYEELWKRYPNCWIAVYQGKLIAFATTIETLLARIEQNRLQPENVARRRLEKDSDLIL